MDRKNKLMELSKILKVEFKNLQLLDMAVTHSSYVNGNKKADNYERLEFLGDSILDFIITEYLYNNYEEKAEGELTKKRALIVCETSLHEISKSWNVGKYIAMSKGEEVTGGRERVSILADCVEAIIAALYYEKGLEITRAFVIENFIGLIERAMDDDIVSDYKTKLQELLQKNGEIKIDYSVLKYEGPPHKRKFYSQVSAQGKIIGNGVGYSRKESEQLAAKEALELIKLKAKGGAR